jgi:hypothetical protein
VEECYAVKWMAERPENDTENKVLYDCSTTFPDVCLTRGCQRISLTVVPASNANKTQTARNISMGGVSTTSCTVPSS